MSRKCCVFQCKSKTHLFDFAKIDEFRNLWLKFIYISVPEQYNPKVSLCTVHFTQLLHIFFLRALIIAFEMFLFMFWEFPKTV